MSGQAPSDELVRLIADLQQNDEDFFAPFQLAHTESSGERVIYLFRAEADGSRVLFGYVLDPAGFRGFIERSLGNRPLLPESAANGRVNNDMKRTQIQTGSALRKPGCTDNQQHTARTRRARGDHRL